MKLSSLLLLVPFVVGELMEVWDENGMVMYYDSMSAERGSAGPPDKGPRMCHGKKIPSVKKGMYNVILLRNSIKITFLILFFGLFLKLILK